MASERLKLSDADVTACRGLLDAMRYQGPAPLNNYGFAGITREQYWETYQSWARGGRAWDALRSGGTAVMDALCWYQHTHRPGSKEWRPAVIIRALVKAAHPNDQEKKDG